MIQEIKNICMFTDICKDFIEEENDDYRCKYKLGSSSIVIERLPVCEAKVMYQQIGEQI